MRTRLIVVLFLSPILPMIGATGLGGCGNAVTLDGPADKDGGGGDEVDSSRIDAPTNDAPVDSPTTNACALPLVAGPCKARIEKWGFASSLGGCTRFDYGGCDGNANRFDTEAACTSACGGTPVTGGTMTVDGIPCTGVKESVTKATAPDGKSWTLDVAGTCGALGLVDVFVASKDDVAYPQSCGVGTHIQMSVGGEGDAGFLAYDSGNAGGACAVASGPSTANQATGIKLTGTVANIPGTTKHTLTYAAANAQ